MIAEVLCVLAGHKSSIFTPECQIVSDFLPLLHPGEVQTLESLALLASKYSRIRNAADKFRLSYSSRSLDWNASSEDDGPSEYLATLGAAITNVLRGYETLVVETEARVLKRDDELVGGLAFVPLSSVRAVFAGWEAPLAALDGLVTQIFAGPGSKPSDPGSTTPEVPPPWPSGVLIDLLLERSQTGVHRVSQIMNELGVALQRLWRIHLTSFMLHGTLSSSNPLAIPPSTSSAPTTGQALSSHQPMSTKIISTLILNSKAIPACVSSETRESMLYVGKAVAVVKGQGQSQKQFPRALIVAHAKALERVLPQDGFAFSRAVSNMREAVSEFLWEHVLKEKDVQEAVESLADYFLLRNGEFAVALIREIERLKLSRLTATASRSVGIREQDLSLALLRASLGTTAQHDTSLSKLKFHLPAGPIRPFLAATPSTKPIPANLPISQFSSCLLGTPLVLTYALEWPLDLLLVPTDLQTYSHLFAYFSAIRRAQHITLECWISLSNAQRNRRRWTGQNEGGTKDSLARMRLLRCGWGVLRQMLWFLDTIWDYLMNDVVGTQYRRFTEQLKTTPAAPSVDPRSTATAAAKASDVDGGEVPKEKKGHAHSASIASTVTEKPAQQHQHQHQPKSHLDFSTLRALHASYLHGLLAGSLLGNPTYMSLIRKILDVCDRFVAQVERWGGDVLPALLSEGSLSEGGDLGRTVRDRCAVVQEIDETLNEHLHAFYRHLSENMSLGSGGNHHGAEPSLLLNASRIGVTSGGGGPSPLRSRIEREGDAARQVEHLLLRLDFNSALSKPPKSFAVEEQTILPDV